MPLILSPGAVPHEDPQKIAAVVVGALRTIPPCDVMFGLDPGRCLAALAALSPRSYWYTTRSLACVFAAGWEPGASSPGGLARPGPARVTASPTASVKVRTEERARMASPDTEGDRNARSRTAPCVRPDRVRSGLAPRSVQAERVGFRRQAERVLATGQLREALRQLWHPGRQLTGHGTRSAARPARTLALLALLALLLALGLAADARQARQAAHRLHHLLRL